jgi:hypothetical protein
MGKANSFRRALHRVYEDGAELTRHPRSGRITLVFYRKRAFESGGWQEALARFR